PFVEEVEIVDGVDLDSDKRVYRLTGKTKREAEASLFEDHSRTGLRLLREDNRQEREEYERFDQRKAEQQHREDSTAGPRVARRAFAGGRDSLAIAKGSTKRGNSNCE